MEKILLDGIWELHQENGEVTEGQIPGSLYSFLLDSRKMEDPYYRENELTALELSSGDCSFTRYFDVPFGFMDCSHRELQFDGIDTIAEIFLNGNKIGDADNFFRQWTFEVGDDLRKCNNKLEVKIKSPVQFIQEKDKEYHVGGTRHAMRGFPQIRKPHCMFGWDWGPRLPDAGIWKSVSLSGWDDSKINNIGIHQHHGDRVEITVDVDYSGSDSNIAIFLYSPQGDLYHLKNREPFPVESPRLWWPNGLGEQPLYRVEIRLVSKGIAIETHEKRIGLRTMGMHLEKDQWGESFAHEVNGQTFFAMGADYIPEDNIFSRITPERTRKLLEDCKKSHFNVIRVWGGGVYPPDEFYDICDELGLVVWQDMMFACANYKLDDRFEENISREIRENVRRIRHHASLGLWCGNNEMEWLSLKKEYDGSDIFNAFYIRLNEHIIPHILKEEDPATFYWPSSPSSGGSFDDPNSPDRGDVHYWEVWHSGVPFAEYRKYCFRYLSEFGFQSFPDLKTIKSFTLPEDRNIFSRVMERHQRNEGANGKIMQYLSMTYLYPGGFDTLVYASQLLQAYAIKYGVEHFRRNRNENRCMGAVYWQLNDIWPVASWASIDYFGRWKALQYYARRFFNPVMISCEEVCELTERSSIIAEPTENVSLARLCITNETKEIVKGTVHWELRDSSSNIIEQGKEEAEVQPFYSLWLDTLDFSTSDYLENHLSYRFIADEKIISEGSVLFTAPKHYHFKDPNLSLSVKGNRITLNADHYAKSVEIYSDEDDFILSDNFFDMEAGSKTVQIEEGNAAEYKIRSVYNIK